MKKVLIITAIVLSLMTGTVLAVNKDNTNFNVETVKEQPPEITEPVQETKEVVQETPVVAEEKPQVAAQPEAPQRVLYDITTIRGAVYTVIPEGFGEAYREECIRCLELLKSKRPERFEDHKTNFTGIVQSLTSQYRADGICRLADSLQ